MRRRNRHQSTCESFHAPVSFGCKTNAIVIDSQFVEREVPAADQRLYQILKRYLDQVLSEMPREDSLLASVRRGHRRDDERWRPKARAGGETNGHERPHIAETIEGARSGF